MKRYFVLAVVVLGLWTVGSIMGQLQQSGGPGSTVTLAAGSALAGKVGIDQTTPGTTNGVALTQIGGTTAATGNGVVGAGVQRVSIASDNTAFSVNATLQTGANAIGSITNTAFGLNAGSAIIGFVRVLPPGCASLVTLYAGSTVAVATGAGTSVNSTTTCITFAYANNITNSAVTLRLADKTGTPIIWLGGNQDFSIPANSNIHIPIEGVTFASGITAIAGTASALNLQINGLQ